MLHENIEALKNNVFLYEDMTPRLFVIFPEDGITDDSPHNIFDKTYRLYFICEHTKVDKDGKRHEYLHPANHRGYVINRPREVR